MLAALVSTLLSSKPSSMPTLTNMGNASGGEARGSSGRNETAADRGSSEIKRENNDQGQDGVDVDVDAGMAGRGMGVGAVLPFLDPRAVSPGASPDASNHMRYDGGEEHEFDGTPGEFDISNIRGGMKQDEVAGEEKNNDTFDDEGKDVVLSLYDGKYKQIINVGWRNLWGDKAQEGSLNSKEKTNNPWQIIFDQLKQEMNGSGKPSAKDLGNKIFDELKRKLERCGGDFYRANPGKNSGFYKASLESALEKIRQDLSRGKRDSPGSVFSTKRKSSGKETDTINSNENDGPTKMPPPVTEVNENDLVVSMGVSKYHAIIQNHADNLLNGVHNDSLAKVASRQVKAVRKDNGKLFKAVNHGTKYSRIKKEEAKKIITKNIRDKLTQARRNHPRVLVVNLKNEKYKTAIKNTAETLTKESDKSLVKQQGTELQKRFKDSGVKQFFRYAGDDVVLSCDEALEKIIKDVEAQARHLHSTDSIPLVTNDGGNESTYISSTRTKRKNRGDSTIQYSPRTYMTDYVIYILPDHGWKVGNKVINGLDNPVITRMECGSENIQEGPDSLVGIEDILDETFLNGIYEEHVVGTDEGREYLKKAGILDDPYSIFNEELKHRRKRRKRSQDENNSHQRVRSNDDAAMEREEDNESEHNSNSPNHSTNDTENGSRRNASELESQNFDGAAAATKDNHDAERGADDLTRNSLDANSKQNRDSADTHGVAGEAIAAETDGQKLLADPRSVTSMMRGERELYRQIYQRIKSKLSVTNQNMNGSEQISGPETLLNEVKAKIQTLQCDFYSHLKRWLLTQMKRKSVLESDLKMAHELSDEFDLAMTELKEAGDDDIEFHISDCELIIKECEEIFPL